MCGRCAADAWYCPRCVEEGKSSSQEPPQRRFAQPHPAVHRSEYQQAALLLGRRDFSSLSAVGSMAHAADVACHIYLVLLTLSTHVHK